jgi:hypothetical protein
MVTAPLWVVGMWSQRNRERREARSLPITSGHWVPCAGPLLAQLTGTDLDARELLLRTQDPSPPSSRAQRTVHRRLRRRAHSQWVFRRDRSALPPRSGSPRLLRAPRACQSRGCGRAHAGGVRSPFRSLPLSPIERRLNGVPRPLRSQALSTISMPARHLPCRRGWR